MARKDIFDVITPEQAAIVLKQLTAAAPELRRKARQLALKLIGDVDVEGVAEKVFWDLDSIAVEEVWDRSGRKRGGYVDPGEAGDVTKLRRRLESDMKVSTRNCSASTP